MSAVLKDQPLEIRPMRDGDLAMVLDIEREAYVFPWSEGIFRDCLRAGYCCWVAVKHDLVRAYGIMQVGAGESHVLNLCVRSGGRGRPMIVGNVDDVRETLQAYRDAGVDELIVPDFNLGPRERKLATLDRFIQEVAPSAR